MKKEFADWLLEKTKRDFDRISFYFSEARKYPFKDFIRKNFGFKIYPSFPRKRA